ncbi:hypothetical protein [Flectobacillus roseus]|uniref:Lipoprotein n=1 Tax=Flectobacillus roseus TaxID=502259 RepID=A0ABT6Y3B2_9BACT|nr:hypothetical protein [Flectobacillus roseus]MDI9858062.1 hypothetical protein [Flectobacillus roseus]
MKRFARITLIFILFISMSCDSIFLQSREFEKEFKNFTSESDSVLHDGDFLHPSYAYMKNGKIIGMEFNSNPECGKITRRYFLDEEEKINKIILEKDYWSEHCGALFDSIFVIEIPAKRIKIYSKSTFGKIIKDSNIIQNEQINIVKYKEEIQKWHTK